MRRSFAQLVSCVLALLACATPCVAAMPDSAAAKREIRVMSDRALLDLNPRPRGAAGGSSAADSLGLPSPGGATALTVGGALAPLLVLGYLDNGGNGDGVAAVTGLTFVVFGPSLGYWYGGAPSAAVPGQLLRLGALGLLGYAVLTNWESGRDMDGGTAAAVLFSGAAYFGSTLYDIGNVGPAVARANERRRAAASASLRPLRDGRPALAFTARF